MKNKLLITFTTLIIFIGSLLLYGYMFETKSIRLQVTSPKITNLPTDFKNVKISYFTDTVIGKNFSVESFQKVTKLIEEEKPDIIIFSGQLLSSDVTQNANDEQIITIMQKMQAPLGKYAVPSFDVEHAEVETRANDILISSGFTILNNTTKLIYNHSLEPLQLLGLNNVATQEEKESVLATSSNAPSLLISSAPEIYGAIPTKYPNIGLTLSGSTFGGLINLPYINKLIVRQENGEPLEYVAGFYGKNTPQQLLVSRGIGVPSYFPIRVFDHPSVYTIVLQTQMKPITSKKQHNDPQQSAPNTEEQETTMADEQLEE